MSRPELSASPAMPYRYCGGDRVAGGVDYRHCAVAVAHVYAFAVRADDQRNGFEVDGDGIADHRVGSGVDYRHRVVVENVSMATLKRLVT